MGLDRSATEDDVRQAFRARSKKLHPDHGGDPAAFRRLRGAYEDALEAV
nr:DnaJ domain-containing protein [Salinibacter ruber]